MWIFLVMAQQNVRDNANVVGVHAPLCLRCPAPFVYRWLHSQILPSARARDIQRPAGSSDPGPYLGCGWRAGRLRWAVTCAVGWRGSGSRVASSRTRRSLVATGTSWSWAACSCSRGALLLTRTWSRGPWPGSLGCSWPVTWTEINWHSENTLFCRAVTKTLAQGWFTRTTQAQA